MKTALRFTSTFIAVTLLTLIIIGLGVIICNIHTNKAIVYTLASLCFVSGLAGAVCELLDSQISK